MSDLLIRSAAIRSDGAPTPHDAIAVRDGVIAGIGDLADMRELAGGAPEVDARGGLVTASFADAHIHAVPGGVEHNRCDLSESTSADDALARIRAYAELSDAPWILGSGWHMPHFPGGTPTRQALDAVVPDRPVLLLNADHHGAWVNTRALELAGVDRDTPDPADGRIEREPDGRPAGTLHEGALELVARHVPPASAEEERREQRAGLLTSRDLLHRAGVTAWHEAIVGDYAGFGDVDAVYRAAIGAGELRDTVTGALWVPRGIRLDQIADFVAGCVAKRERNAAAGFRTDTLKFMLDGVAENQTAALHSPYLGHTHGDGRGIAYFDDEVVKAVTLAANAAGFAVHFHVIGDRAATSALDAVAAVPSEVRSGVRNHLAHVQVVEPVDVPRFAQLDVTVNAQALWACEDEQMLELTEPILGAERYRWQYPFADLLAAGAELAMGSDWPVSTFDPWQAIHVAVTRRPPGEPDAAPLDAEQAIGLDVAINGYTRGSHRLLGFHDRGELAVGQVADLAIANRDPFAGPADDIHLTRTRVTVADGRVVADNE